MQEGRGGTLVLLLYFPVLCWEDADYAILVPEIRRMTTKDEATTPRDFV